MDYKFKGTYNEALELKLELELELNNKIHLHNFSLVCSSNYFFATRFNKKNDTTSVLKFRNIGPAVGGGRVSSVVGIPGQPNIYYIGAAGGGVFKTTDGGFSWKAIFEKEPVSSIGAIALAPSNPNLVWVGTGEANIRNDVLNGKGVYYSPDGGTTWNCMGLTNAGQISKIVIDPVNPKIVFVAALGHPWAPNKERGLYKTIDGGKTWKKVLFINDTTGISDVVIQPGNPEVMLAAAWQVVRHPWALDDGGTGSGIYQSKDGGETWKKITEGIPKGLLGRISLAASPSNPGHVYALIESKKGVLWDSHDFGDHWQMVSNNHELNVRPFYFSRMVVAPDNDEKIYFLSFLITVSNDGGKTVTSINKGIHVDHHAMWIDPKNPERIIEGNDGGVYLSMNGGDSWHFLNNLPIEQFYQVALDTSYAYNLGGGLQDNNAWYGPSRNLNGGSVDGSNWFVAAGGDGEYVVPAPGNPSIIYAESQDGYIQRLDTKTGIKNQIRPYFFDTPDMKPSQLKYRFNWTTPIAVSSSNENEVYLGANVLFKTTNGGKNWDAISPDLTRNDKSKQVISGGPINYDVSGAETYGTILSIGLSDLDPNVIWIGTDDGQVQVTKDGGKSWINVTKNIPGLPEWGRVYQVDVSPFNPGTCFIAVDRHMMDDSKPYVYKIGDYGKSWTSISKGLPENSYAIVVREDPNVKGFLVAGTETGLFYSNNDGDKWLPLQCNFPTAPVFDLKFAKKNHDLVVATHGRGLFILDNITPLEEMPSTDESKFKLFSVLPAYLYNIWYKGGFNESGKYTAPNPPGGAVIDYFIKDSVKASKEEISKHETPVKIEITDSKGALVDTLYGTEHKGINRTEWNLNYSSGHFYAVDTSHGRHPMYHGGPRALPGTYNITVDFNGKKETKTFKLMPDPRIPYNLDEAQKQFNAEKEVQNEISAMNDMLNRIDNIHEQIDNVQKVVKLNTAADTVNKYKPILTKAHQIDSMLIAIKDTVMETKAQPGVGEDDIHYLTKFRNWIIGLRYRIAGDYDSEPNQMLKDKMVELRIELNNYLNKFNIIIISDVSSFNKLAGEKNIPILVGGAPFKIGE
ncbi:MAG: VPS10 domain-containing protein [Ignavibacteriaceae bacterium]